MSSRLSRVSGAPPRSAGKYEILPGQSCTLRICRYPRLSKSPTIGARERQSLCLCWCPPGLRGHPEPTVEFLVDTASKHAKIIAIGETGLDYYRMGDRSYESMEWQRDRFRVHIHAAIESKKPLIIHTRSASVDTIKIMKEEGADRVGGVMHCFTESYDVAKQAMDLGFYISFSGIVTFKSATELQETCKKIPLERLLIETDSPYLAPIPFRGKTNEPAWVSKVGEYIAQLKNLPINTLADCTTNNFFQCFQINRAIS